MSKSSEAWDGLAREQRRHHMRCEALAAELGIAIPENTPLEYWAVPVIEALLERVKALEARP